MKRVAAVGLSVCLLSGAAYTLFGLGSDAHVVISELGASNDDTIADEDGDTPDWIELHNPTEEAVSLEGWSLTTDRDHAERWTFPAVAIDPGAFLLVFASGKDRHDPGSELHTSFKLRASGEYLALVDDDDDLVHSFEPGFGPQHIDISFGLGQEGAKAYFEVPTPGATNGRGALGFVDDAVFDTDRGLCDDPFDVTITSTTRGASIIYTLDGSEPGWTNGTAVAPPGPEATPTATVHIPTTTVLRAAAFKERHVASRTATHTYVFPDQVIASPVMDTGITRRYGYAQRIRQALTALPTISIVDPSQRLKESVRWAPYPDWTYDEFPVSFEVFTADGSLSVQEDAGAARFGGHFYNQPQMRYPFEKWSYRIFFRDVYGATTLEAPLFEGFDNGIPPVETFDQLVIRSGSHDMKQRGFYMSGALAADTMLEMGNLNPHTRFVHVYINGTYWGQYSLRERWNASTLARYKGGQRRDYEAIKAENTGAQRFGPGEPYGGDGTAWANVLAARDSYEKITAWVDIQSYVDFMLMFMFGEAEPEFRAVGSRSEDGVGFLFSLRDPDGYTGWDKHFERTGNDGPGEIFGSLVDEGHPELMSLLGDRIHKHLFNGGALTEEAMARRLLKRCDEVEVAFTAEAARWGKRTPYSWARARDEFLRGYLAAKPESMLENLIDRGLYPTVVAPFFSINGVYQHGGAIEPGDAVSMSAPSGTIYYTLDGDDPRCDVGHEGGVYTGPLPLAKTTHVKARVLDGNAWSALNEAVYTVGE